MSTISDFNTAAQAGMDREHEVQLSLLRTLCAFTLIGLLRLLCSPEAT